MTPATIDMEISIVKTMVSKAFDNNLVGGRTLKAFRRINRLLRTGTNARDRLLGFGEYLGLIEKASSHVKALLKTAYNTGMRKGELLNLRWSHIDRDKWFIRLSATMTKERKPKNIPINQHVRQVLAGLPRQLHEDYVFTYRGQPFIQGFRKSLKTACKNADIPFGRKVFQEGSHFTTSAAQSKPICFVPASIRL